MVGNICEIRDGPSGLRFYFLDFGFDLNLFVDYFLSRMVGKVCVIGGGPSGLGILCWFAKLKREGKVRLGKFLHSRNHPWCHFLTLNISILYGFIFFQSVLITTTGHPRDCLLWKANFLWRPLELLLEDWLWWMWRKSAWKHVQVGPTMFSRNRNVNKLALSYPWVAATMFWEKEMWINLL